MKSIWRKTFFRVFIFQFSLLFAIVFLFVFYGVSVKNDQADLMVSSMRNSFLIGDNRNLIDIISNSLLREYTSIKIYNKYLSPIVILGEDNVNIINYDYTVNIFANPQDSNSLVGKVKFSYELAFFIRNALVVWCVFFILSIPFLFLERKRLIRKHQFEIRIKEAELANKIAEQVSHDIRSPLAVLQMKIGKLKNVEVGDAEKIKMAIKRIESIANDLLERKSKDSTIAQSNLYLSELLSNIVEEKKIEYHDRINVNLNICIDEETSILFVESSLKRILSNLINNSYEAIDDVGEINICLSQENQFAKITISDNGKGIPENILKRIGERGFSHGKKSKGLGTGLGVYSSREIIESSGGSFNISSKQNEGTIVTILINRIIEAPNDIFNFVYIDDDELLRLVWREEARKKGVRLLILSSPLELNSFKSKMDREKTNIYIDYELGENLPNGVEIAESLYLEGYKNLYITSGHPAEKFQNLSWLKWSNKKCPF